MKPSGVQFPHDYQNTVQPPDSNRCTSALVPVNETTKNGKIAIDKRECQGCVKDYDRRDGMRDSLSGTYPSSALKADKISEDPVVDTDIFAIFSREGVWRHLTCRTKRLLRITHTLLNGPNYGIKRDKLGTKSLQMTGWSTSPGIMNNLPPFSGTIHNTPWPGRYDLDTLAQYHQKTSQPQPAVYTANFHSRCPG